MADANRLRPTSTRAPDDDSDHVGSGASTPPGGVSTPRPDFTDKRQPGLAHAYFAQVCDSLRSPFTSSTRPIRPSSLSHCVTPLDLHGHTANMDPPSPSAVDPVGAPPPTAPSSPKRTSHTDSPALSSQEGGDIGTSHPHSSSLHNSYPTPPLSSASSFQGLSNGDAAPEETRTQTPQENSISASPARLRSSTLPSTTVDAVISRPAVSAHISSPAAQPITHLTSDLKFASLDQESKELTDDSKSTPPRTPRALSQNDTTAAVDEAPATAAPQIPKIEKNSRSSSNNSSGQPTVGATKGQLSVNIVQGRGLRPSTAPYVVCIYQLNEDISGGAEADAMDTHSQEPEGNHDENLARGVAMRRIGSDQGKPMSIPSLGSRQSSQTDIAKLKGAHSDHLVTEPLWNHEAVL